MSARSEHRTIGPYRLLTRIGAGSTGTVFAAHDPRLDRQIALKLVPHDAIVAGASAGAGAGRETAADQLQREARVMARLSHPNIIPIHDIGTGKVRGMQPGDDEVVYIAMELIDGASLREWLQQTARSWREVLRAYLQAGRGLAAAHKHGIVHRDFKPHNVLIGRDNRVRVVDFGLARPVADTGVDTGPGQMTAGTPAYMAPEQHEGQPCDERSDQFSFCVSLYEAVYQQRPFAGRTVFAIADEVLSGNVRPPPAGTRVPGWLHALIMRGLNVAPGDRHPSMRSLLASIVFTARVLR